VLPYQQIESPLLSSILFLHLVPRHTATCRAVRLPASTAGRGCRVLPGLIGTSEQTWSKHGDRKV